MPFSLSKLGYHTGIISKGFTLPLWNGLPNTSTYENADSLSEDKLVDISDYLKYMPHSATLPLTFTGENKEREAYLCEWMAYSLFEKSGIKILPSRDNVKIVLSEEEIEYGKNQVYQISVNNNSLPVVVIVPYSTTKNKNLPRKTLEEITRGISGFAIPCLLKPYKEEQHIEGTTPIGEMDLRKTSAILYSADAYIGVDSGPLHIMNAVLQGNQSPRHNVNSDLAKVIFAAASSHPAVIGYKGNRFVQADGECDIAPCGAHGYWPLEQYAKMFNIPFYGTASDKSGCRFENYPGTEVSQCMNAVSSEEIIESVREILKN